MDGSHFATAGSKFISDFCHVLSSGEQHSFKRKLAALFPRTSNLDQQRLVDTIERLCIDLNSSVFAPILKRELGRFHHNTRTAFVRFTDYWLRMGHDEVQVQCSELKSATSRQSDASDQLYQSFLSDNRDRAKSRILGIISVAGNGKSVLFARLCHIYSLDLIAVHVCKYSNESTRDPVLFVKSIVVQLVKNLAPFGEALGEVQEATFKDKTAKDVWNEVIVTPLKKCAEELAVSKRRRFIAIDALDGLWL